MRVFIGGGETTSAAIGQLLDQLFNRPNELDAARSAAKDDDNERLIGLENACYSKDKSQKQT